MKKLLLIPLVFTIACGTQSSDAYQKSTIKIVEHRENVSWYVNVDNNTLCVYDENNEIKEYSPYNYVFTRSYLDTLNELYVYSDNSALILNYYHTYIQ